jgi:protease-4
MSTDPTTSTDPAASAPAASAPVSAAAPTAMPPSRSAPVTRAVTVPPPKKPSRKALIGFLLVVLLPLAMCAPLCLMQGPANVDDVTLLELDLEQPLDEVGLDGAMVPFLPAQGATLMDVLRAIEKAKGDPKVKGIVARVGTGNSLANIQELREALASFKESGKITVAYAESFGEMAPGVGGYAMATAFDEIWLQPSGDVMLTALFGEGAFFRGAFDKAGVEPQISGRKEYKNAVNQYTETTFTAPHREAMERLLTSYEEQLVDDIAASRGSKLGGNDAKSAVKALLLGGPLSSKDALEKGLVDHLGYKDEVLAAAKERVKGTGSADDVKLLWVQRYGERAGLAFADEGTAPVVALIVAKGAVTRGKNGFDALSGSQSFGSDTTTAAIRAAAADDDVKVILLRVDSPGGSYVASDTIHRALEQAKTVHGKKVVVSMGDLAASGGYFVAMNADTIVASRATITGSIGVFAGKFVTTGLWEKVGVAFEPITSASAVDPSLYSNDMPYSEGAQKQLDAILDRIYLDFTTKAAAGRKMAYEKLEPLAHGRVWTGADAKERGLVDELGGFLVAVKASAKAAGATDGNVRLRPFPRAKEPFEELLAAVRGEPGENSDDVSGASAVELRAPALRAVRTLAGVASDELDGAVLRARVPQVMP